MLFAKHFAEHWKLNVKRRKRAPLFCRKYKILQITAVLYSKTEFSGTKTKTNTGDASLIVFVSVYISVLK